MCATDWTMTVILKLEDSSADAEFGGACDSDDGDQCEDDLRLWTDFGPARRWKFFADVVTKG